jgi:hypothetical protein
MVRAFYSSARYLFNITTAADSTRDMVASPFMAGAQAQPGQPQDYNKLFKAEKDNLELAQGLYQWNGKDVELRVLQKWGKLPRDAVTKT